MVVKSCGRGDEQIVGSDHLARTGKVCTDLGMSSSDGYGDLKNLEGGDDAL